MRDYRAQSIFAEWIEHDHSRARQERRDHLERRILGRRADQRDEPALDVRQERVLLRSVPSMNLVDKKHRALAAFERAARVLDRVAQIGDSRADRREAMKLRARLLREQDRERRLARARRPPQDHRVQLPRRDHPRQQLAGTKQMLLPDYLFEPCGPHPVGKRLRERRPRLEQLRAPRWFPARHAIDASTARVLTPLVQGSGAGPEGRLRRRRCLI